MDSVLIIKIISTLIYPLGLAFCFALLALLLRWFGRRFWSRVLGFVSVALLIMASNPLVASWLAFNLERQYPQQDLKDIPLHDAIIVLGGGVRIPLPPAKHTQLGSTSDRFWYAAQLYQAGKAPKIVLTGGNLYAQDGFDGEAVYAAQLLEDWGVPSSAIVYEVGSRTTSQNQSKVAQLLKENDINSALLVTSALHMPRAYRLFSQLPVPITPTSCDTLIREQYQPQIFDWLPSANALRLSTSAMHEYYGIWFTQVSRELNAWIRLP